MLRLILGRAGTGKTALLFSEIAARCARRAGAGSPFLAAFILFGLQKVPNCV